MPPSAKQTLFWIIPLTMAPYLASGASCLVFALKQILQPALTGLLPDILKSLGFLTPELILDFIRNMAGHGRPKTDLTDRYADALERFYSSACFPLPCILTN